MFSNIATVTRREFQSYFLSPVAYVILAVFALLYGIFFNGIFLAYGIGNLQFTYGNLLIVLLFMAPIMAMRSLAEERKMGTEELLMTAPVTTSDFVLGKYFALACSFLVMLGLVLIHLVIVLFFTVPDFGPIISSYIGLILVGLTFLAIGLFTSSLSDNQIISGLLGFGILLFMWLLDWVGDSIGGAVGEAVNSLSLLKHYNDFAKGIIDTANIVFYLSIIAVFLFLTIRNVESRRWR